DFVESIESLGAGEHLRPGMKKKVRRGSATTESSSGSSFVDDTYEVLYDSDDGPDAFHSQIVETDDED
ncbi:unnamed protein product, partial [Ectocarpus sp. 4 AP-2014]